MNYFTISYTQGAKFFIFDFYFIMQINQNVNFKAGLTSQIRKEIAASDVQKISSYISQQGVKNDFKNNKIVAWCSLKSLEIMKKLKLGLPKGIFVEDFFYLNVSDKKAPGLLNFAPAKLYLDKDTIVPEKTIFFNEYEELNHTKGNLFWDNINEISDQTFENNLSTTDFFLEMFLHEFSHVAHETNLIEKLGGTKLVKLLQNLSHFQIQNSDLVAKICQYAVSNPLEAVACDLSKRIIISLDRESLIPKDNCIRNSPYRKLSLFHRQESRLDKMLRAYWNGKFTNNNR